MTTRTVSVLGVLLVLAVAWAAGQEEAGDAEVAPAAPPATAGPVEVTEVSHFNSSLVLYDEHGRRYTLSDGWYRSDAGAMLEVANGAVSRLIGCGSEPCDMTTHATRTVENRLLFYVEIQIADGRYDHTDGSWFRIEAGQVVEYGGGG